MLTTAILPYPQALWRVLDTRPDGDLEPFTACLGDEPIRIAPSYDMWKVECEHGTFLQTSLQAVCRLNPRLLQPHLLAELLAWRYRTQPHYEPRTIRPIQKIPTGTLMLSDALEMFLGIRTAQLLRGEKPIPATPMLPTTNKLSLQLRIVKQKRRWGETLQLVVTGLDGHKEQTIRDEVIAYFMQDIIAPSEPLDRLLQQYTLATEQITRLFESQADAYGAIEHIVAEEVIRCL